MSDSALKDRLNQIDDAIYALEQERDEITDRLYPRKPVPTNSLAAIFSAEFEREIIAAFKRNQSRFRP